MRLTRLGSIALISVGCVSFIFSDAYAEYYSSDVCPPKEINVVSRSHCHVKRIYRPHRHHCHHYRVRPKCYIPRSRADISVYYVFNSFPAECSCRPCVNCTPCSYCPGFSSYDSHDANFYTLDNYDDNYYSDNYYSDYSYSDRRFYFDRRTADDIGAELNIDY